MDEPLFGVDRNDIIWALQPRVQSEVGAAQQARARPFTRWNVIRGHLRRRRIEESSRVNGGPWVDAADDVLRIWNTENQRLAVGASRTRSTSVWALAPPRVDAPTLAETQALELLMSSVPDLARQLRPRLRKAAMLQMMLGAAIDHFRPRVCVIGSPFQAYVRLFAIEARRRGIPSVYVPHAPAATNVQYSDIPADFALVSTSGDRDHYASLGASAAQMAVIGDPLSEDIRPRVTGPPAIVFATTTGRGQPEFASELVTVKDSVEGLSVELVVAPHPSDRDATEITARRFGVLVHHERTSTVFSTHHVVGVVAERASGVLLNAARLGIRAARWSGPENYVFESEVVSALRGDRGLLREFVSDAVERTGDPGLVGSTRPRLSERWEHEVGATAIENRERFLAGRLSPIGPALDRWNFWPSGAEDRP